ncbi:hypothetical protein LN040_08085 [Desulfovibrio subterraneus]|uniref:hypothetical protein n=1 Tax=Desulfovibrio subterraneus TaxID=2718620 RepID=UPI0022B91102|nr:hypothetical protein [Desulfovibrio subterraneus]WBF69039.1 hypothetical protein LN040_08085 [Desulfovibrio subterraneus]
MIRLITGTPVPASRRIARVWFGIMLLMTVTGMGQMPIFKRYYIADIPGLGWLADPYTVHWVHYAGAIALVGLGAWLAIMHLAGRFGYLPAQPMQMRQSGVSGQFGDVGHSGQASQTAGLTTSGKVRIALLVLIIITGYMRVAKNLPDFHWSAAMTVFIDWSHLGFAMLLGIVAVMARLRGNGAYVLRR